jgi:hypothetical protein
MSRGSPRGLLFFGHLNKITVTVTVTVTHARALFHAESESLLSVFKLTQNSFNFHNCKLTVTDTVTITDQFSNRCTQYLGS